MRSRGSSSGIQPGLEVGGCVLPEVINTSLIENTGHTRIVTFWKTADGLNFIISQGIEILERE